MPASFCFHGVAIVISAAMHLIHISNLQTARVHVRTRNIIYSAADFSGPSISSHLPSARVTSMDTCMRSDQPRTCVGW